VVELRIYVAAKLDRADDAKRIADLLRADGHIITYEWWTHGAVHAQGIEAMRAVAMRELAGVLRADLVIVLLPGARGSHVELGAALAAGRDVVLVGALDALSYGYGKDCAFYHHPHVSHVFAADADLRQRTLLELVRIRARAAA
jgi:nucleoside 2-deoxyribosyltransferase